eukprot:scaffold17618_cov10-Prasinocladus_malaysianus.AAC.1
MFKDKAQFLQLALAPARFYLRELHDVVATKNSWAGRVHMTRQLRRDLLGWTDMPYHSNWLALYLQAGGASLSSLRLL